MKKRTRSTIFARVDPADFVGRTAEIERLLAHILGEKSSAPIAVLAAPGSGSSELLRQLYDGLFNSDGDLVPIYFEVKTSDKSARDAAIRFLKDFLVQTVAFRRRDPRIIGSSPEICEVAELAVPDDGYWIDRLIETCDSSSELNDVRSMIRNCFSAPARAAAAGVRSCVMIDGTHRIERLDGGTALFEDLAEIASKAEVPFILSGLRRSLFAQTGFESLTLEPLPFKDAGLMIERLAARLGVKVNDQTRDLVAVQLNGYPAEIARFARAARGKDVSRFDAVAQIYTDEIFGGRTGRGLDAVFETALPDKAAQKRILALMAETSVTRGGCVPEAYWQKHAKIGPDEFRSAIEELHIHEIINHSSGTIGVDSSNNVVRDYVRGRTSIELDGMPRAQAVGEALAENIRRAPQLMASFYRRSSSIGLRELMLSFNGQKISPTMIEYGRFKTLLKGADDEKILKALKEDNERFTLPRIFYTAHTAALYPKLNDICETERSAIGLGTADSAESGQVAWIAAEIDSKLEASRELTEFWCDRLEMAAESSDLSPYQLWLVAPEGFSDEALSVLRERNALGSSRKQVSLLAGMLNTVLPAAPGNAGDEYEIVIPMGDDTEIIAARTVEDIAKRHDIPQKTINQIKTAVVEACINAAEHGLSPDRKIYQKFSIEGDKLTISIYNRGVRLADKKAEESPSEEGRRGWGLKLMKGLMDDVQVEHTDDGTRVTMVKVINRT